MSAKPRTENRSSKGGALVAEGGGQRTEDGGLRTGEGERGFEVFISGAIVAERMEVDIQTVSRLVKRGVLRCYRVGALVRFKWSEVEEDLRQWCRPSQKAEKLKR